MEVGTCCERSVYKNRVSTPKAQHMKFRARGWYGCAVPWVVLENKTKKSIFCFLQCTRRLALGTITAGFIVGFPLHFRAFPVLPVGRVAFLMLSLRSPQPSRVALFNCTVIVPRPKILGCGPSFLIYPPPLGCSVQHTHSKALHSQNLHAHNHVP